MPGKDIKVVVNSESSAVRFSFLPVLQLSTTSSMVLNFLLSLYPKIRIPNRVIKKKSSSESLDQLLTHT